MDISPLYIFNGNNMKNYNFNLLHEEYPGSMDFSLFKILKVTFLMSGFTFAIRFIGSDALCFSC